MADKFTFEEKERFFSEMLRLSTIYTTAKRLILLSEYYNSKQGIVISTINELRNSLDHIMRALLNIEKLSDELFKAEGHLYRAIYDACEVIIIDRLKYIEDFKNEVSFDILNETCPNYYIEILPYITVVKENLVNIRQIQKTQDRIREYEDAVAQLIQICDELDKKIPLINIEKEKKKKEKLKKEKKYYFSTSTLSILLGSWAVTFGILSSIIKSLSLEILIFLSLLIPLFLLFLFIIQKRREDGRK
jgi:hypothetical protein